MLGHLFENRQSPLFTPTGRTIILPILQLKHCKVQPGPTCPGVIYYPLGDKSHTQAVATEAAGSSPRGQSLSIWQDAAEIKDYDEQLWAQR